MRYKPRCILRRPRKVHSLWGILYDFIPARVALDLAYLAGTKLGVSEKVLKAFFRVLKVTPGMTETEIALPGAVEAAVEILVESMDLKAKAKIAKMAEEDVFYRLYEFVDYIRGGYDLVSGNLALMNSCRIAVDLEDLGEEDAAHFIFMKAWEKLRETHALKVIL